MRAFCSVFFLSEPCTLSIRGVWMGRAPRLTRALLVVVVVPQRVPRTPRGVAVERMAFDRYGFHLWAVPNGLYRGAAKCPPPLPPLRQQGGPHARR